MDANDLRTAIRAANADVQDRLKEGSFRLQYDSAGDVFYFALTDYSPSNPVVSLEDADANSTSMLRVEDETWRIIGFDILDWRRSHLHENPEWERAFELLFQVVGDGDFKIEFDPEDDDPIRLYYVPQQVEELIAA